MGVARGMTSRAVHVLSGLAGVVVLSAMLGVVAHLDAQVRLVAPLGQPLAMGGHASGRALVQTLAAPPVRRDAAVTPKGPDPIVAPSPVSAAPVERPVDPALRARYEANVPKGVLELQQFRVSTSVPVIDAAGRKGLAALTNISPRINVWFLLAVDWGADAPRAHFHLENPFRHSQQVQLTEAEGGALLLVSGGNTTRCDLWRGAVPALVQARRSGLPYAPLCGGRLFLRNQVEGYATDLEQMTDFLRDNVWAGDEIVGLVKDTVYKDSYREEARAVGKADVAAGASAPLVPAQLRPAMQGVTVAADGLGLAVADRPAAGLALGRWYRVRGADGVLAGVMRPDAVADEIMTRNAGRVTALDATEGTALAYMVAFDMSRFELRFGVGTDHPGLGWSARVPLEIREAGLPGPDGVGSPEPLVLTGMVGPARPGDVIAAFAGGFKREHGGFKWGELAQTHAGSHYGFVEGGAVLSKLRPGLSTLYTLDDGSFGMKTWRSADDALLPRIAWARQNGVALVEPGPDGVPVAGALVSRWGPGNWSGSATSELRTLRAGACLLQSAGSTYLVYGVFTSATPSAMSLTFQAYGCSHALNLDMNALEHTYLAVYAREGDTVDVQHLVRGMAVVDRVVKGKTRPRFLTYPDNRDLFYLVRKRDMP